jgi:hypothetical protein
MQFQSHVRGPGLVLDQVRVLAGPCERRSPVHDCAIRPLDAGDLTAEVNRPEVPLLKRGHYGRGRPGMHPRGLRPDPERRLVASDRMARIDVERT